MGTSPNRNQFCGANSRNAVISDLPLSGRNYIQLVTLAPGVFVPQRMNTVWTDQFVAINGNRAMQNTFLLDGVVNNTTDNSNPAVYPPDALAEFKVQTNAMGAEFGRAAGGVINVIIKSGTNRFRGNLFEFLRNEKLDANQFFNSGRTKPSFRQNQFGGTLGGPIVRNRMFFFMDYQGTRLRRGRSELVTVPLPEQRTGDFSRASFRIFDPLTSRPNPGGTGFVRDQFAGNVIPANRISPVARRVVDLYPQPRIAGALANNFVGNSVLKSDTDQFGVRLDGQATDKVSIFGRISGSEARHFNPGSLETVASGTFVLRHNRMPFDSLLVLPPLACDRCRHIRIIHFVHHQAFSQLGRRLQPSSVF